jgi:tRNA modification GTPase
VKVVVAGPANAGKSSLINTIAGQDRAIVTAVPGTTRDHIEVPLAIGGVPILLTDTAGLRATEDEVERIGIGRAEVLIQAADVLLWLGEPDDAPDHPLLIRVHARSDLPGRGDAPSGFIAVSSVTGEGIERLRTQVARCAQHKLPEEGALALNRRQAVAIGEARDALVAASTTRDPVLAAEHLRQARAAFDRLTGRAGVEDLLDTLFGRFCLGK